MTSAELDSMVAPVALYPETLLGLVLAATRHSGEVQQAAQLLKSGEYASATNRVPEAAKSWDPAVIALLRVPAVLKWMGEHTQWTERLGQAVSSQSAEVYAAIDRVRQQIRKATSTVQNQPPPQAQKREPVVTMPTNQIIYVPVYERVWPVPIYQPYAVYYGIPYYVYPRPRLPVHNVGVAPVRQPVIRRGPVWQPIDSVPITSPIESPGVGGSFPFGTHPTGISGGTMSYGAGSGGTMRPGAGSGGTFR
jgi:gas vesicle protein